MNDRITLQDSGRASSEAVDVALEVERMMQRAAHTIRRRVVATPAEGAEVIEKLRLILEPHDDVFIPTTAEDTRTMLRNPDDWPVSIEVAALHDDIVRLLAEVRR